MKELVREVLPTWGIIMMIFLVVTDLFVTVGFPWAWFLIAGFLGGLAFCWWALYYIYLPTLEQKHTLPPDPPELVGAF